MLNKEPLIFPTRTGFVFDLGISDRQLWALGMVVVQWSLTEMLILQSVRDISNSDNDVQNRVSSARNFRAKIDIWREQIKGSNTSQNSLLLGLAERALNLSARRAELMHRPWAGGMQQGSPAAEDHPTSDAFATKKPGEKIGNSDGPRSVMSWNATFIDIRKVARDLAALNRDLALAVT